MMRTAKLNRGDLSMAATKGFFAVGRDSFLKACSLGINEGAAFLVLARGTGGDNVTTKWSAEAASKRLGVRWTTARDAVASLVKQGVVLSEPGKKPKYKIQRQGDDIWLPNAVVDGVESEIPPVTKIRQTQDPMVLRLFVELYAQQNLREDGGISRKVTEMAFKREKIGQRGAHVVWLCEVENTYLHWGNAATDPHRLKGVDAPGQKFFQRFGILESLGLVEWVPYLFEGPKGEPIHPLAWNGIDIERRLYGACKAAANDLLTAAQKEWLESSGRGGWLVPAPAHMLEVTMFGIARLRYRPHTRLTSAWWADYQNTCARFAEGYESISEAKAAAA